MKDPRTRGCEAATADASRFGGRTGLLGGIGGGTPRCCGKVLPNTDALLPLVYKYYS